VQAKKKNKRKTRKKNGCFELLLLSERETLGAGAGLMRLLADMAQMSESRICRGFYCWLWMWSNER